MSPKDLESAAHSLAAIINDPTDKTTMNLAFALIRYGRSIQPRFRHHIAEHLEFIAYNQEACTAAEEADKRRLAEFEKRQAESNGCVNERFAMACGVPCGSCPDAPAQDSEDDLFPFSGDT